jgi:DNA invertase Pin-like site-specific DNA recombinase
VRWEASRGSRRLSEWARFIELCEVADVRIHVTTHGRTYDPANARDRRTLQEDGTDSEYESAKTSARARRSTAAAAAKGQPHGRVPYGSRPKLPAPPSLHRDAQTSSVATCAASTVSNRPMVVIGDSPGGSSSRT